MGKTPPRPAEKRRPPPACQGASGRSANFLGSAAGFLGAQNRLSTVSPSALSTDCGFFFSRPAWVLDAPDKICPPAFPPPRWRTFIVFWAFKIPNIIITYWKAFAQYAIFAGRGDVEGYFSAPFCLILVQLQGKSPAKSLPLPQRGKVAERSEVG